MKNLLKYVTVSIGLCLGNGQLQAAQTNLLQYLNIRGILYYQGPPVTNSFGTTVTKATIRTPISNADLISRFGALGGVNFSSSAKLVIIHYLNGSHHDIVVEDGAMRMDVGSYIDIQFKEDSAVETAAERLDTGAASATRYQLLKLKLHDTGNFGNFGLHFDTEGLSTVKRKTLFLENTPWPVDRSVTKLTGDGKSNNEGGGESNFLASLTCTVTGGSVEVVE